MKKLYFLALLAFVFNIASGQIAYWKSGEVIVRLADDYPVSLFLTELNRGSEKGFFLKRTLAPEWNFHLISFDPSVSEQSEVMEKMKYMPGVRSSSLNYRAEERNTEPNDNDWFKQWGPSLIGTPKVWDLTTGGLTPAGDTIVVAVLEKGADMEHTDLAPNRWFNWGEIPDDNIDNDDNGFVDDFSGWNPRTQSDDPGVIAQHGTGVNGIIGAMGNNGKGISGINWRVKLMNLGNIEFKDEIIEGYFYAFKMRQLYNQSNGAKGAFVVATNSSFGINNLFAANHMDWCVMYDSLGKVGVLNAGATSNSNVDVDMVGDLPTTCPSEYLIAVNNLDRTDKKAASTGFGKVSIDLGAPGSESFTTNINNSYAPLGGTSAATPHVAGSIALLYSLNCESLTADALTAPATCARRFRDIILENVKPIESLEGITTTGGRLDLSKAVDAAVVLCGGSSSGELAIEPVQPNPLRSGEYEVYYQTPDYEQYELRIFDALGRLIYQQSIQPEQFSIKKFKINTNVWATGYYFLTLSRGRKIATQRILKY